MHLETFQLERRQSLWENRVAYNLTETGIHPFRLRELLNESECAELLDLHQGYGQTNGSIPLRESISRLYPDCHRDRVLVTNGSIEANFVAIWSLLEPGDELVLMLPNYMQIWGLARSLGVEVKPFYLKESLGWQPDLDELARMITPKTKMIAVCNPNNPTGSVLSQEARERLVTLADSVGAWLYADEIYRGAELEGPETPSFFGTYEKAMVCGGLSKAYALPGLRIGWLVGPQPQIEAAWACRDYTTIATTAVSNYVANLALEPARRDRILTRNRRMLVENLDHLQRWAEAQNGLFRFRPPSAGGMAFLHYDLAINSTDLVERVKRETSTLIVAGDCFGMDHWVRIGIGSEPDYLLEGLDRFERVLASLKEEVS